MAMDFPNSPTVGQLYPPSVAPGQPQYQWTGTAWTTQGTGTPGGPPTTASQVVNVPAGTITSTTVQAALNELDTKKVAKAGDTMTGPLNTPSPLTVSGSNAYITTQGDQYLGILSTPPTGNGVSIWLGNSSQKSMWLSADNQIVFGPANGGGPQYGFASPKGLTANGVTGVAFTGATSLGLHVCGGNSNSTDYAGIDFSPVGTAVPYARIGATFGASGSTLAFGTSNAYSSGITNTALTIDQNAYCNFYGTVQVNHSIPNPSSSVDFAYRANGSFGGGYLIQDGSNYIGFWSTAGQLNIGFAGGPGGFPLAGSGTFIFSSAGLAVANNGYIWPTIDGDGWVGTPTQRWYGGNATAGWNSTSDERVKSTFSRFENALGIADKIDVCSFDLYNGGFKDEKFSKGEKMYHTFGIRAQQLRTALPGYDGVVFGDEEKELLSTAESKIGILALAAVKELAAKVAALEARLKKRS